MNERPSVKREQLPPPEPIRGTRKKKRYEYKFHAYIAQNAADTFNVLGDEGWLFIGQCATGASVFVREK